MHPMLNIAVRAARAAGNIIVRYVDRVDAVAVSTKAYNEFVTEVDRQAEHTIIDIIHKAYPHHGVLGEETGSHAGDEYLWIVDPLDGTTNFVHGFPHFAVSIALQHKGRLSHGVIYDPLRAELFMASQGEGARLGDRRIRVSRCPRLREALLGTGFPFRKLAHLDPYLATLRALTAKTAGIRRAGSAALDLAYVAAGRLDGFWEFGLEQWDMAAGVLLIQEAGGIVSAPDGGDGYLSSGDVVTGPPRVLGPLLETIQAALPAPGAMG